MGIVGLAATHALGILKEHLPALARNRAARIPTLPRRPSTGLLSRSALFPVSAQTRFARPLEQEVVIGTRYRLLANPGSDPTAGCLAG